MFALNSISQAAIKNEGAAVLRTLCAIACNIIEDGDSKGLAVALFESPVWHRSEKSAQNYAAAATATATKRGALIAELLAADPKTAVTSLTKAIGAELTKSSYKPNPQDVSNWANDRPSMAHKAAEAAEAHAAELAAIEKFNRETAAAHAAQQTKTAEAAAQETETAVEAAALRDAITAAQVEAAANTDTGTAKPAIDGTAAEVKAADPLATPPAKPVKDTNPVVLSVRRNKAGELYIVSAEELTPDELRSIAATLSTAAEVQEAEEAAAEAIAHAETEAEASRAQRIALAEACAV